MIKVAIVGNIASGKTTIETILAGYGFKVFDTDHIAHEILEKSLEVKTLFGTTDRKEIAKIVFSDKKKLEQLESIIHPKVRTELLRIFAKELGTVFVSVPQLFESGMECLFDKIIYVTADKALRRTRLMNRNNLTFEEAEKRILAQNEESKAEKSDFVIINNENIEDLKAKLIEILSALNIIVNPCK